MTASQDKQARDVLNEEKRAGRKRGTEEVTSLAHYHSNNQQTADDRPTYLHVLEGGIIIRG